MSRSPGFAIEVRERYRDVIGDRWPLAVEPQIDELVSSWLHRLSIANGVAPQAFASVLGLSGGMWSARLDWQLPQDLAAWLGARTPVAPEAISAMAMTNTTLARLWLPQRATAHRRRSTWLQFCGLCLAEDRVPYFRRCWRLASRISCFRHGCGLRDRCPACRGGLAPYAQTDVIPHHVCAHCGFDLRGAARISVEAGARRLERSVDDFCQAEIARRPLATSGWVARLTRIPHIVGIEPGRSLVNLSASARIRCFERLARMTDDGSVAARERPFLPTRTAGGRDGLIGCFVECVEARQGSARARAPDVDLAALLAAYGRVVSRGSRGKPRGA